MLHCLLATLKHINSQAHTPSSICDEGIKLLKKQKTGNDCGKLIIFALVLSEAKRPEKRNRIRVLSVATSILHSLRNGFHPWQRGVGKTASTEDPISKPLWHRTSQGFKPTVLLQVPFPSCVLINLKNTSSFILDKFLTVWSPLKSPDSYLWLTSF